MTVGIGAPRGQLGRVRRQRGRRGGTHETCGTGRNLEVGRDEIKGEFEAGEEGGGEEGDVAATLDGECAEDGEGDEEGAGEGERGPGRGERCSRACTWVSGERLGGL